MSIADERRAEAVRRVAAGETLEAIAKSWGVTRERIRQILLKDARLAKRREAYRLRKLTAD